ncbi:hypothetical protein [Vibrio phage vB_VmeM-Yong XC32]|nr:hypothetical protein [Vibrio phage vB_VmeM-Yong XC31]QAX96581.1 hypothetical protein [Vibrio phage vB_VmeM-Yong XC32]QAX96899.1 hypothetical protein [Vibrio phage vB_VmeM-Yong MS31]QAX97204.1 hypothetical protein [Vibrio phage vB_VmeM-Yong MS32]
MRLTYRPEALKRLIEPKYRELCYTCGPTADAFNLAREISEPMRDLFHPDRYPKADFSGHCARTKELLSESQVFYETEEKMLPQQWPNADNHKVNFKILRFNVTEETVEKYGDVTWLPVPEGEVPEHHLRTIGSERIALAPFKVERDQWREKLSDVYKGIENTIAESVELNDDEVYALRKLGIKL